MTWIEDLSAALRAGFRPAIIALRSILSKASARASAFGKTHQNQLLTVPQARAAAPTMSTAELNTTLTQLQSSPPPSPQKTSSLLSTAKRQLLSLNALLPTPNTSPQLLGLARTTLETGALLSIRLQDPDAFTRYFQQLLPFYELPPSSFKPAGDGQRSKVTGLYLLLLLTKGDYAGFHTVLEGLEVEMGGSTGAGLEADKFIGYPVKLERWLMEGSYDRVWGATKREGVPGEEFGVFSEVGDPVAARSGAVADNRLPGPHRHDPFGNRVLLGESVPVAPHRQREEPAVLRERRGRGGVRAGPGLGGEGRPDILPVAARRRRAE